MFKNIHYDTRRSKVYLWEQTEGDNDYRMIDWVPYVFEPDSHGHIETVEGIPVRKVEFRSYQEYSEYQKHHKNNIYENESPKEIQFLSEWYHTVPDNQIEPPKLKVYSIDIEVHCLKGFPKPDAAAHPVSLINVREFGEGGINKSWGLKPYTGDWDLDYTYCETEQDLLKQFFEWWYRNAPDVVTGWNIAPHNKTNERGGFDLPYLVNRSKNLFGKKADVYKKLSPIGIVRCWDDNKSGAMHVDIAGVAVLDYFALYKWYTTKNPENYKLDTIAREELGLGKLDYSAYTDLRTLYEENWNLYVEYNVIDNQRVMELEDKLGYILLAQSLSLLCRCQMEQYTGSTHLVEGLMLTHFRRNDLCAPRLEGGHQEWFPAAFVKEPQKGQYDWIVDLDIASSYPTAIITLNMSSETYYGRCIGYKDVHGRWIDTISGRGEMDIGMVARMEAPIAGFVDQREFPTFKMLRGDEVILMKGKKLETFNRALKAGLLAVAPSGSMYLQNKKGAYAQVVQQTYAKRQEINGLKKEFKGKAKRARNEDKIKEYNIQANKYHALQWALKIVINSAYGVTGVPYSRFFNVHTAEAICSCGRRAIINGQKYVNRWFTDGVWKNDETLALLNQLGTVDTEFNIIEDMVAYIDTDSVFIKLGAFVDKVVGGEWKTAHEQDVISDIILALSKHIETYVNDCAYTETQVGEYNARMTKEEFSIMFKQEIVCKSALFITKKKYGYHVVNDEGTPTDKIDVTGMEIIRSETPSAFKDALKELLSMVLRNAPDDDIYQAYAKAKLEIKFTYPEEISENKGVKGLGKWLRNGEPIKGTPYHVKAVASYHKMLRELNLEDEYIQIEEDTKNKLVYVKKNPYGVNCIMYDRWPKEFTEAGVEPDFKTMIEKFLTNKLRMLLEPAKREHILETNQAFNAFFG